MSSLAVLLSQIVFGASSRFAPWYKPVSAEEYVDRGEAHFNKHEWDRAIEDFDQVIHLKPDSAIVYVMAYGTRGVAYDVKGEKEKALADYQKALELQGDLPQDAPLADTVKKALEELVSKKQKGNKSIRQ